MKIRFTIDFNNDILDFETEWNFPFAPQVGDSFNFDHILCADTWNEIMEMKLEVISPLSDYWREDEFPVGSKLSFDSILRNCYDIKCKHRSWNESYLEVILEHDKVKSHMLKPIWHDKKTEK